MWNELTPIVANCANCIVAFEDATNPPVAYDARTTLIHELGHCPYGLDHPNLEEVTSGGPLSWRTGICDVNNDGICGGQTNFTASGNSTDILLDLAQVPGDAMNRPENNCPIGASPGLTEMQHADWSLLRNLNLCEAPECPYEVLARAAELRQGGDAIVNHCFEASPACSPEGPIACPDPPDCCPQTPGPPIELLDYAWFRTIDNDPFVIDPTIVIESESYSRALVNIPAGDWYAASANRLVGENLGYQHAQSVVFSLTDSDTVFAGLSADDVNMVRMAMTGADRQAGDPDIDDDYTVTVVFTRDCASAAVDVGFSAFPSEDLGSCLAEAVPSFTQGLLKVHWTLVETFPHDRPTIDLGSSVDWALGTTIFIGNFESEDLTEWHLSIP